MKPAAYVKKVRASEPFKEFMKEDPNAYLCSLFFTRDLNDQRKETQVDFYSPKKKVIISFNIDKAVERVPLGKKAETITHKKFVPKPLKETIKMDFDEIEPTLMDEMHNRGMTYQIEKVFAFVNIMDGETIWNCTGFLKGLGLVQAHVEDKSGTVLFMDKKSLFDLMSFTKGGTAPGTIVVKPGEEANKEKQDLGKEDNVVKKDDSVKKEGK